ncbi:hypothetical protein DFP92_109153 [Yoonia sediminilitoris]|uniref:Uncharacterized protein n=2 Tax=Yoonia sediminilitoris TaxID=1286148 RepID=A0A2T6KD02_9RHOB|nr:hypothetical protein [Yoonia sediminilitoris]PUB12842.1 hypothetical protein C8N45_109153 [Yoonia sediminilitoris]RCW94321.1 hypothetical protein DFP92_109153 [Yoonia sediminilitoris]
MIFERAQGKANVASLVERKTRFAVLFRNNDRYPFDEPTDDYDRVPAPASPQIDRL